MSDDVSAVSAKRPQQRKPDWWPTAQALFLQGVTAKELAKQYGVSYPSMRKRIERAGLSHGRTAVKASIIAQRVTITRQASAAAQKVAERSLRPILHDANRRILESKPLRRAPKSLAQAEVQARVVHTVTQSTKIQEGWSDNEARIDVRELEATSGEDIARRNGLPLLPAIDVASEAPNPQASDAPANSVGVDAPSPIPSVDADPPPQSDGSVGSQ